VGDPINESRPAGEHTGRTDYELSPGRALAHAVHDKQVPVDHTICVTTFAGVVAMSCRRYSRAEMRDVERDSVLC